MEFMKEFQEPKLHVHQLVCEDILTLSELENPDGLDGGVTEGEGYNPF